MINDPSVPSAVEPQEPLQTVIYGLNEESRQEPSVIADVGRESLKLLGVSTSAYQIEGAWNEDGKGESIWDRFTHLKGINGDIACDEYHKIPETIELLKGLGVNVYRFSIAWTRIQPNGRGDANPKGIAYYSELITKLKEAGIEPMATLYHWDLPQALEDSGGWTNRETVNNYVEYTKILFREFGHQVKYWITHNEPRVVSTRGYGSKTMAPGLDDPSLVPIVNHHLLLSHGLAVKAYRSLGFNDRVGISLNLKPVYCRKGDDTSEAIELDKLKNQAYLEPILLGKHPDITEAPFIQEGDMEIISQPIDFLGVNYYSRAVISSEEFKPKSVNCLGWETYPQGLYDLLKDLKRKYPSIPPIIITENGFADHFDPSPESIIQDGDRIDYIQQHIRAVQHAKEDGVLVIGYLVWSLTDNLEWSFGYGPQFGLVHVDFKTLKRKPKESYYIYRDLVASLKRVGN